MCELTESTSTKLFLGKHHYELPFGIAFRWLKTHASFTGAKGEPIKQFDQHVGKHNISE